MISLVLTVLLALSGQPDAQAPSSSPALQDPPKSELQIAQDAYARTQQLYTESCGDRAYGAYDDICSQLAQQVHRSRVDLDRLESLEERRSKAPPPR